MSKLSACCVIIIGLVMTLPGQTSPLGEGAFDTISISADVAEEDMQPGILYFKGHFIMRSEQWHLESERATVFGPPDRPDEVHLEGSPARFNIIRSNEGILQASAPLVEYQRDSNTLKLSGGAELKLDQHVIRSTVINYDISTDRYQAYGAGGVGIRVPTTD